MKQLLSMIAGVAMILLVGYVRTSPREAENRMLGTWVIDVDATRDQPEYGGKGEYLDAWRGSDGDTLVRITPNRMVFWDQEWPYRIVESGRNSVTIEMNDVLGGDAQVSRLVFEGETLVFTFTPATPYVLRRAGGE